MKKMPLSKSMYILIEKLKEIRFTNHIIVFANKCILDRFKEAKENKLTLNQYISLLEDDNKQITVVLSSEISYFCIKRYFVFHANKFLSENTNGLIRILSKDEYTNREDFEKFKNLSFDLVFDVDGIMIPVEIKFTQGESFSGATHSTSKVDDYLLIKFEINRNIIVDDDVNFIESAFISLVNLDKNSWVGEASNNSSWTKLDFRIYDSYGNQIDYSDGVIHGALLKKNTKYEIKTEKV